MARHPSPTGPEPSADEKKALKRVKAGQAIDAAMKKRLLDAGLIKTALGGTMLTDNGKLWEAIS